MDIINLSLLRSWIINARVALNGGGSAWILTTGFWKDSNIWVDDDVWKDGV
jgi:hypothetical protein